MNQLFPKVAIVDYDMGNLFSIQQACQYVGANAIITADSKTILEAEALILPGVGAFGDAIYHLQSLDLISPIKDFIASGKPVMGICLGLQLLFEESEEHGHHKGLGVIAGSVRRFPKEDINGQKLRVPHIGWNQIFINSSVNGTTAQLPTIQDGEYFYFVHSYSVHPTDISHQLTMTTYCGINFCSAVAYKNIYAFQFHPEKSAQKGLTLYRDWLQMVYHSHVTSYSPSLGMRGTL